ncbi:MAG TPA: hypothetical protein VIM64_11085 [Puia sp.]
MNTPTPYEQLIAAKLDQIPVPDMADSVWSSIGMQLDAGADAADQEDGAPDQGDGAPDRRSGSGFKGWHGFLGAVVIVATVWWYYSHTAMNTMRQVAPPVIKAPAPVADTMNSIKKKNVPAAPAIVKKDTAVLHPPPATIASPDTVTRQILPPVRVDSPSLHNDWVPFPFFDSLSVKPPGRKPRGVKGITSDDYKISAGKDHH